jgi:hypothetical protein
MLYLKPKISNSVYKKSFKDILRASDNQRYKYTKGSTKFKLNLLKKGFHALAKANWALTGITERESSMGMWTEEEVLDSGTLAKWWAGGTNAMDSLSYGFVRGPHKLLAPFFGQNSDLYQNTVNECIRADNIGKTMADGATIIADGIAYGATTIWSCVPFFDGKRCQLLPENSEEDRRQSSYRQNSPEIFSSPRSLYQYMSPPYNVNSW